MIVLLLRDDRCLHMMLQALKSLTEDNAILCPSFQLAQRTKLNGYLA